MSERLDTLIKCYEFTNDDRPNVSLVGDVRLDAKTSRIELKKDALGFFPTSGDHYVISEIFQPTAVREWSGLQAFMDHQKDGPNTVTGDGFRLHDGTDQYWWDGGNWVVNSSSWNTEDDVAANISSFPTTTKKLRVVVRLTTTDKRKTPSLAMVKVSWKAKVQYLEDIIYRTLVPFLRGIRPLTDYVFKVPFPGGLTLDVGAAVDDSGIPFNVTGVDSIFDHTSDPSWETNLLSSYDVGTGKATLSSTIPVGNYAACQIEVEPEVSVNMTHPDFLEVEKAPALILSNIRSVGSSHLSQDDHVVNKGDGSAVRVLAPYRFDLEFDMIAIAPGAVDLLRLKESIVDLLENNRTIRSAALDREYRIILVDEVDISTTPNSKGLHSSQGRIAIRDILAFRRGSKSEQSVTTLKFRGDANVDVS